MTGFSYDIRMIKKLVSLVLIVSGGALIIEHLITHQQFDLLDIIGHETYGFLFILAGILISTNWKDMPALLRAIKAKDWKAIFDEAKREKYRN